MLDRFAQVVRACACFRGVGRAWARKRAQARAGRERMRALDACAASAIGLRAPTRPQAVRRARGAV